MKLDLRKEIFKYMKKNSTEDAMEVTVEGIAEAFCMSEDVVKNALDFLLTHDAVTFIPQMIYALKKKTDKRIADREVMNYLSESKIVTWDMLKVELNIHRDRLDRVLSALLAERFVAYQQGFVYKFNKTKKTLEIPKPKKRRRNYLFEEDPDEKYEMKFEKTEYYFRVERRKMEKKCKGKTKQDDEEDDEVEVDWEEEADENEDWDDFDWLSSSHTKQKGTTALQEDDWIFSDSMQKKYNLYLLYPIKELDDKSKIRLSQLLNTALDSLNTRLMNLPYKLDVEYLECEVRKLQRELYEEGIVAGFDFVGDFMCCKDKLTEKEDITKAAMQIIGVVGSLVQSPVNNLVLTKDLAAEQASKLKEFAQKGSSVKELQVFDIAAKEFQGCTEQEYDLFKKYYENIK